MKYLLLTVLLSLSAHAQTMKLYGTEDIGKLIEIYAQATGQKFILDPGVRGRVTLLNKEPVSYEEAFNQISAGLAIHGYAISKQGDLMLVRPARSAQRDLIEVSTTLPALKPERMATWIVTVKHTTSDQILREFRNITTKDGDIHSNSKTNQLIISDYTSNLHRFAELLKNVDKQADPAVAKYVEQSRKEQEEWKKMKAKQRAEN